MLNSLTSGQALQKYLMASYCYYILGRSPIPDDEYDAIAKRLLDEWDTFDHRHKHLLTPDDLRAGTLYHLRAGDYPLLVQHAAERWAYRPNGSPSVATQTTAGEIHGSGVDEPSTPLPAPGETFSLF